MSDALARRLRASRIPGKHDYTRSLIDKQFRDCLPDSHGRTGNRGNFSVEVHVVILFVGTSGVRKQRRWSSWGIAPTARNHRQKLDGPARRTPQLARKACIGSTDAARRAGSNEAVSASNSTNTKANAKTSGS